MIQYIVTPIVAAAVGYFTNDIAIRMLFRPHTAKYLMGHRIPFTPGLIPKERGRIATSLGLSISQNLMNQEVLEKTLLSEEMLTKIESAFNDMIVSLQNESASLREFSVRYFSPEELTRMEESAAEELSKMVTDKLVNQGLGTEIAHLAVEHALQKMGGGVLGIFGGDKLLRHLQEPAERLLRQNIDEMLANNGPQMAEQMVKKSVDEILSQPVNSFLAGKEEQIDSLRRAVLRLYRSVIEQQLPKMLTALNLPQMIEERINEMDIAELERLIFEIMDKELKAIVWFGAGLGFLIGCLNCLIL